MIQQSLHKALKGKPARMSESDWEDYDLKVRSAIHLCLIDEVLYNILNEDSVAKLWLKLESLYMTKSLTNRL